MPLRCLIVAAILYAPMPVVRAGTVPVELVERVQLDRQRLGLGAEPGGSHALALGVVVLEGTGWPRDEVLAAIRGMAGILATCGVRLVSVDLQRVGVPPDALDLDTPRSRQLAGRLLPVRPTLYFVRDTRHRPAFDAEAIGRGNSRTRPEMADSVWVTRAAPDLPVVLAHELVHVLTNRGDHVTLPGNLMRADSAPGHVRLTEAQCAGVRDTGARLGLLKPLAAR